MPEFELPASKAHRLPVRKCTIAFGKQRCILFTFRGGVSMIRYYRVSSRLVAIAFTIGVVFMIPVRAQVTTGDITGRVTDAQARVVAGATVTATNKGTGAARTATTNDAGEYTITQLPPGRYDLSAEAKNFSKSVAQD